MTSRKDINYGVNFIIINHQGDSFALLFANPPGFLEIRGAHLYPECLSPDDQNHLVEELRELARRAPFFQPVTPSGKAMSVRITAAGKYGWYSDRKGYRYRDDHPSGVAWPPIPKIVLETWDAITGLERAPDCCLVNYYEAGAKMGLHQDKDETDFSWPVLSISLGDRGLFRIGNETRGGKTESVWLNSGDVLVLGGDARLRYHGIDRIDAGSSTLLSKGGRINLTLRVVD